MKLLGAESRARAAVMRVDAAGLFVALHSTATAEQLDELRSEGCWRAKGDHPPHGHHLHRRSGSLRARVTVLSVSSGKRQNISTNHCARERLPRRLADPQRGRTCRADCRVGWRGRAASPPELGCRPSRRPISQVEGALECLPQAVFSERKFSCCGWRSLQTFMCIPETGKAPRSRSAVASTRRG